MRCEDVVHEIYHYLDGETAYVRRTRLSLHLRRCDPCHDAFDFEKRLLGLVQSSCAEKNVPPELLDRLRALIEEEAHRDDREHPA